MINNNLENCATSVTRLPLIQRIRNKRQSVTSAIKDCSISSPITMHEEQFPLPQSVIDWIAICLDEGHIQPSQPPIGRLEGWPIRPFFKNSLYIDFECWCLKMSIPNYFIPSRELFYQGTDTIFESLTSEKYQFSELMICREKFSKFIKENQYD